MLPLLLGLLLLNSVALDAIQELLSTFGMTDVLDPDVDSLLHVATVDDFVADHTDRSSGHVVDDAGLAMVDCPDQMWLNEIQVYGHLWGWEGRRVSGGNKVVWGQHTMPFCSEEFALMSTISPTRYSTR